MLLSRNVGSRFRDTSPEIPTYSRLDHCTANIGRFYIWIEHTFYIKDTPFVHIRCSASNTWLEISVSNCDEHEFVRLDNNCEEESKVETCQFVGLFPSNQPMVFS